MTRLKGSLFHFSSLHISAWLWPATPSFDTTVWKVFWICTDRSTLPTENSCNINGGWLNYQVSPRPRFQCTQVSKPMTHIISCDRVALTSLSYHLNIKSLPFATLPHSPRYILLWVCYKEIIRMKRWQDIQEISDMKKAWGKLMTPHNQHLPLP